MTSQNSSNHHLLEYSTIYSTENNTIRLYKPTFTENVKKVHNFHYSLRN